MKNKISFFADAVICATGGVALIYLLFTYALPAVLPLIFGWLFSLIINPLSDKIASWSGAKKNFIRGFLCIFLMLLFLTLLSLAIRRLFIELSGFLEKLSSNPQIVEGALDGFIESIRQSRLFSGLEGILSQLGNYAALTDKLLGEVTSSLFEWVSSHLSHIAGGAIAKIPTAFLFAVTFILSSYYFCTDGEKITRFLASLIPLGIKEKLKSTKKQLFSSLCAYLKSSIILLFMTFIELFFGLFILRVKYPFIISLIIAIIDFLPILGAGLILIPWAIYCFISKNTMLGVGLFLLFLIVSVVRKMLEPKIMAKKMGAHPLALIASIYVGFKLIGGWGLILAPIICSAISPMLSKTSNISIKPTQRD